MPRRTPTRSTAPATAKARATVNRRGRAGITYDEVRQIAGAFPGVEEGTSYGTPALKVRGALMVRLKEDGETIVLKTTLVDRDLLLRTDPKAFFVTDHYLNYPYVLVRLSVISASALRDRIEESWRRLASKRDLEAFDQR